MKITDKIREIRLQKNVSQEYLASYLGIDTSSYYRIERGISPLSIQRLEKIVEALDVQLMELFPFDYNENQKKQQDDFIQHLEGEIRFLRNQLQDKMELKTNQTAGQMSFSPKNAGSSMRL